MPEKNAETKRHKITKNHDEDNNSIKGQFNSILKYF